MPATTPSEYVRLHMDMITSYSRSRRFRPWFIEPEEFLQTLVLGVLDKHSQFRNDGGTDCPHCGGLGCSTWLGWRARRVATDLTRQHDRDRDRHATEAPIEEAALMPASWGSHSAMQRQAQVAQVLRVASSDQRAACMTVLGDMDGPTVHAVLGIKMHGRNYRLRGLSAALYTED